MRMERHSMNAAVEIAKLSRQLSAAFLSFVKESKKPISIKRVREDFGAVGDGYADDTSAINLSEAWLSGSTIAKPRRLVIDCPVRFTQQNKLGAITLIGVSGWSIEWASGGRLLMDNLSSGLGTGGGIFASGPAQCIELISPHIEWVTKPTSRSLGDGFLFKGHPSDLSCISTLKITGQSFVKWAPQAGGIFIGCKDVFVNAHVGFEVLADNLHFNACQRPNVISNTAISSGDDAMAFVTYYHASDIGGGSTGWQTSRTPYNQPSLGLWSNTDCSVGSVVAVGGVASGCRIAGVNRGQISQIIADGKYRGLMVDSGISDGSTWLYTYLASSGVRVGSVTAKNGGTVGAEVRVFNQTAVSSHGTPSIFKLHDIHIGCVNATGMLSNGVVVDGSTGGVCIDRLVSSGAIIADLDVKRTAGLKMVSVDCSGRARFEDGVSDLRIDSLRASYLEVLNTNGNGTSNISLGRVHLVSSPNQGAYFKQINGLHIDSLRISEFATLGDASKSDGLSLQAASKVFIGSYTCEASNAVAKVIQIGGNSDGNIGSDIRVLNIHARLNRADNGVVVQGGLYAPVKYAYSGRWLNSSTGLWAAISADTFI